MAVLAAIDLQGFLDKIEDSTTTLLGSSSTYANLITALRAFTAAQYTLTASGEIKSTSANGHEVTFADSSVEGSRANDYRQGAAKIRDIYRDSRLALISSAEITSNEAASTADPKIFAEMRFRIGKGVKEVNVGTYASLIQLS